MLAEASSLSLRSPSAGEGAAGLPQGKRSENQGAGGPGLGRPARSASAARRALLPHPLCVAAYAAGALVLSMCAIHPLYGALWFAGAFAAAAAAVGVRAALGTVSALLPIVLLAALVNPFVSAEGATTLLTLLGTTIQLEPLVYGATMGLMLATCALWIRAFAEALPLEDLGAATGGRLPVLVLLLSMIGRLTPRFVSLYREADEVARACSAAPSRGAGRLADLTGRFGQVLSWSLEGSLIAADSMAARGWNRARRTSYLRRRLTAGERALAAGIVLLACAVGALELAGAQAFAFYPRLSPIALDAPCAGIALYALIPQLARLRQARLESRVRAYGLQAAAHGEGGGADALLIR